MEFGDYKVRYSHQRCNKINLLNEFVKFFVFMRLTVNKLDMGQAKEKQLLDQEQGFASGSTKTICINHFEDPGIRAFIEDKGHLSIDCYYCSLVERENNEERKTIPLDRLVQLFHTSISRYYGNPDDVGIGYDRKEGGYMFNGVYTTQELLTDVLELEVDEPILEDISSALFTGNWVTLKPHTISESAELFSDWEAFCYQLKHKVRYVFFNLQKDTSEGIQSSDPSYILDDIGEFVSKLGLFYNTEKDGGLFTSLNFFRSRQHTQSDLVENCKQLGPPPADKAGANRFSPAGITMFYGARRQKTAIEETINRTDTNKLYLSTGCFNNIKPLNLIDLTNLPNISFFDEGKAELYQPSLFLQAFARNVSKTIIKDGREHFEYVPTQVVTEFFRYIFPKKYGIPVDGIVYNSAVQVGEVCYVLFIESSQCVDEGKEQADTILVLEKDSVVKKEISSYPPPRR